MVLFVVSYEIVVKVGWKEQEPETELSSTSDFQSPILKLVANFSGMGKLF